MNMSETNSARKLTHRLTPLWLRRATVGSVRRWWPTIRWQLHPERLRSRRLLAPFHNKHQGERCFIIGNGPSLRQMDLSPLQQEVTFGLNRIYLMFPELGFHTTYLASVNKLVLEQCSDELAALPMPKFFSKEGRPFFPRLDNQIYLNTQGGLPQFSFDPGHKLWESATVTYVALQLAYFMGFKQVILIGVDHNFTTKGPANKAVVSGGDDPNHFAPNYFGKGFRWQLPDLDTSEIGYTLARDVFAKNGREVIDATVGGKLHIFPKVAYESLF